MRLDSRIAVARPLRPIAMRAAVVAIALFAAGFPTATAPAADPTAVINPLAYVPSNAAVFAHLRVGDLWNSPLIADIRKGVGKDLDKALASLYKESGLKPDDIDTITFFFPTMPQGPGDETTFVAIATATKPLDKDALFKEIRGKKKSEIKDGMIPLADKLFLTFPNDRTFVVLHETNIEKFKKGPLSDRKPGAISDALKLAGDKHHFVLSADFSMLPNEILTAGPPEIQPFMPLLKAKSGTFYADLKDKDLKFGLQFTCTDGNTAQDAERAWKLLMTLASDGLTDVLKDEKALKDIGPLLPALKELQRGVKNVKVARNDARLEMSMTLKADMPIAQMVTETLKKLNEGAARAQALNNLKQIGLAMHNYHSANDALPAAAICDKKGKPLLSWRVAILPYIEYDALYKEFKLDEPWDSEHNKKLIAKMPKTYANPGQKDADSKTHYRVFTGNGAGFELIQSFRFPADFPDGTSNTCMVVETADAVEWTKPEDIEYDPKMDPRKSLRWENDRTLVAIFDGSVRAISKKMSEQTWHYFIQRNDGNPLGADFE